MWESVFVTVRGGIASLRKSGQKHFEVVATNNAARAISPWVALNETVRISIQYMADCSTDFETGASVG
jgi:hypothetical protein